LGWTGEGIEVLLKKRIKTLVFAEISACTAKIRSGKNRRHPREGRDLFVKPWIWVA